MVTKTDVVTDTLGKIANDLELVATRVCFLADATATVLAEADTPDKETHGFRLICDDIAALIRRSSGTLFTLRQEERDAKKQIAEMADRFMAIQKGTEAKLCRESE